MKEYTSFRESIFTDFLYILTQYYTTKVKKPKQINYTTTNIICFTKKFEGIKKIFENKIIIQFIYIYVSSR